MRKYLIPAKRLMKGLMLKFIPGMISCNEFEQFIDNYLEQSLPFKQLHAFERHLKLCRECRDYLEAYRHSISLGQKVFASTDATIPENVPKDLLKAVLESKNQK